MRLGKKEAAGYVADIETDEIPDAAALQAASGTAPAAESLAREPLAREPEKVTTAS